MPLSEMVALLDTTSIYIDNLPADEANYTFYRLLGVSLFDRNGVLIVKTDPQKNIIRYDWYLDDFKYWRIGFKPIVITRIKDTSLQNLILHPITVRDFNSTALTVKNSVGEPERQTATMMAWPSKFMAFSFDSALTSIRFSKYAANDSVDNSGLWRFKNIYSDDSLLHIPLGISMQEVASKFSLRTASILDSTDDAIGILREMDFICWGIPGTLLFKFDRDNKLILLNWEFSARYLPRLTMENTYWSCLDDLEEQLGKFGHYPTDARMQMLAENGHFKIIGKKLITWMQYTNNTLVLNCVDLNRYPPPPQFMLEKK